MHVLLIHSNYHSGGAEIAGNWPPAWVAYLAGSLKAAGYERVTFLDAMTNHMSDEELRARMMELAPDIVGVTSITPSIYMAEQVLAIAREAVPDALRVLGGVHATFMHKQVLSEAPDVIVRGEGEEIFVNLVRAVDEGRYFQDRRRTQGLAFRDVEEIVATQAAPTVKDLDGIDPDWSISNGRNTSMFRSVSGWRSRTLCAAVRSPARSARSGSSGATTGCAIRKRSWTRSSGW